MVLVLPQFVVVCPLSWVPGRPRPHRPWGGVGAARLRPWFEQPTPTMQTQCGVRRASSPQGACRARGLDDDCRMQAWLRLGSGPQAQDAEMQRDCNVAVH